ncbi:MAG: hypothetical protein OXL96_28720 [Candidatus Poribacteria bacterium]|nr:hypothetical protein [Candidatus Poribacteria bacterium]
MKNLDLKLLILILVHFDPGMSGPDLVDKVARARNMKMQSGRVYEWAYHLSNEVGRVKKDLKDSGLLNYKLGKNADGHTLLPKGKELLQGFFQQIG